MYRYRPQRQLKWCFGIFHVWASEWMNVYECVANTINWLAQYSTPLKANRGYRMQWCVTWFFLTNEEEQEEEEAVQKRRPSYFSKV